MNYQQAKKKIQNNDAYKSVTVLKKIHCVNCNNSIVFENDVTICVSKAELARRAELEHAKKTDCFSPRLIVTFDSAIIDGELFNELANAMQNRG